MWHSALLHFNFFELRIHNHKLCNLLIQGNNQNLGNTLLRVEHMCLEQSKSLG